MIQNAPNPSQKYVCVVQSAAHKYFFGSEDAAPNLDCSTNNSLCRFSSTVSLLSIPSIRLQNEADDSFYAELYIYRTR